MIGRVFTYGPGFPAICAGACAGAGTGAVAVLVIDPGVGCKEFGASIVSLGSFLPKFVRNYDVILSRAALSMVS